MRRRKSAERSVEVDEALLAKLLEQKLDEFSDCLVEWYWIEKPWYLAAIIRRGDELEYKCVTHELTSVEKSLEVRVYNRLVDRLCFLDHDPTEAFAREARKLLRYYFPRLNSLREAVILHHLWTRCFGYERMDPLMKDPYIEDISCNGPGIPLYVYHMGHGFLRTNISFTEEEIDDYVARLAELAGKFLSAGSPVAEGALPDGSRLTAFWRNDVSDRGSGFSIRRFREEPLTPIDLIRLGTLSPELVAYLWVCVEYGLNALILGGTASGKTSTLNALCLLIPSHRRIVTIEDTREIRLPHENWVPLVAREERVVDGSSEHIDLMFLLKRALRMRPEYLIVGEVRGVEANVLFQAMNVGHIVYSTMHAADLDEAVARLTNPPISVPMSMLIPLDLVLVQAVTKVGGREARRCVAVYEVDGVDIEAKRFKSVDKLFEWRADGDRIARISEPKKASRKVSLRAGFSISGFWEELEKRTEVLEKAAAEGVSGYRAFINYLGAWLKRA